MVKIENNVLTANIYNTFELEYEELMDLIGFFEYIHSLKRKDCILRFSVDSIEDESEIAKFLVSC